MNKEILKYDIYYFLGIGGIGMSALARYFSHYGKIVGGYDKTPTALTTELENEGMEIHFDENTEYLEHFLSETPKEKVLIILTPAVPADHAELKWLQKNKYTILKRSQVLGEITKAFKTVAIAGTHGKTTTTTMVTHILKTAGFNCYAFLGGISKNYGTNLLLGDTESTQEPFVVVEADEYDRSFMTLFPYATIITSVDADHLDIYGNKNEMEKTYEAFAGQVRDDGFLLVKKNVDNTLNLKNKRQTYSVISTPSSSGSEFESSELRVQNAEFYFDLKTPTSSLKNLHCGIPGQHNVENATAAAGICQLLGVSDEKIREAIDTFSGVKRRFDYRVKSEKTIYIDDYAHHPEELKACITAARSLYPQKKISGIFQPHLFSRTKDFADGFAEALDLLDECVLLPIYPAREKPIEGVNSEMLIAKMKSDNKKVLGKEETLKWFSENTPQVLLTLGAGDIDSLIAPLEKLFRQESN